MSTIARTVLAAAALALLASPVAAEILDLAQNRGGFFVGVNFANQGGDMDRVADDLAMELQNEFGGTWTASKGANLGLGVGGFYVAQLQPTFGVEIEFQYVRRGVKIDIEANGASGIPSGTELTSEFQVNYLEVPVLARFSPSPAANLRPVLLVGPVVGLKTSANAKMTIEDESQSTSISEGYEDLALGLLGGVGISARVGATSYFILQARYYLGLTNPIAEGEFDAKSSDFGFFAGMEFTLK